jgi:hypothetical protein
MLAGYCLVSPLLGDKQCGLGVERRDIFVPSGAGADRHIAIIAPETDSGTAKNCSGQQREVVLPPCTLGSPRRRMRNARIESRFDDASNAKRILAILELESKVWK